MKQLTKELPKYDPMIAYHPFNKAGELLYPQYDKFLMKEKKLKLFSDVHLVLKQPGHQNLIMITCCLLRSKKVPNLKKATTDTSTLMDWLKIDHIIIEGDSMG